MANKNTLTYRVDQLEKTKDKHDEILFGEDGILTNHLPSIGKQILKLSTRMDVLTAINLGSILVALLINKFL